MSEASGEAQELLPVGTRVRGDAAQPAFLEQVRGVVQPGIADSQMPATASVAPVQGTQGDRHEVTGGGEEDRAVQRFGRRVGRLPHRVDAEVGGEPAVVFAAREHVHPHALAEGQLRGQVRCRRSRRSPAGPRGRTS